MLIIEVFLCIFLVLLFYQCCKSGARRARQHMEGNSSSTREDDEERSPQVEADIQRIHTRNNMYERGYRTRHESNAATREARKQLVEKNLFSRRIVRGEKSVRDLKELLAISRSGGGDGFVNDGDDIDEEIGQCCNVSTVATDVEGSTQQTVTDDSGEPEIVVTPSIEEAAPQSQEPDALYVTSSLLANPSAPPPPSFATINDEETSTCVDTIATAISTQPAESAVSVVEPTIIAEQSSSYNNENTSTQPKRSPQATLEVLEASAENTQQIRRPSLTLIDPLRNLWSNLITTNPNSTTETTQKTNINTVTPNGISSSRNTIHYNNVTTHKLECSICLENFEPNDTIAWAKDGGDPPSSFVSSTANNDNDAVGCDHIFHRECLVSWLQNSDKCPLCIRKIVHQDAETRFSGWE